MTAGQLFDIFVKESLNAKKSKNDNRNGPTP